MTDLQLTISRQSLDIDQTRARATPWPMSANKPEDRATALGAAPPTRMTRRQQHEKGRAQRRTIFGWKEDCSMTSAITRPPT